MHLKNVRSTAICLLLVATLMFCTFATMFSVTAAGTNNFSPRLTSPEYNNKYYYDSDYNIFQRYGYGLPNCTAYAFGRAYEILGYEPSLSWNGASQWYGYNASNGYYKYGQTPKLGAIACWTYGSGGHVAVVEKIENGTITLSNSEWGGRTFYLTTASTSDPVVGGNSWWTFQGYIYLIDSPTPQTQQQSTQPTTDSTQDKYDKYVLGQYKVTDADTLNIRSQSNTSSNVLGYAYYGETYDVIGLNGSWGQIKYKNSTAWICLNYCTLIKAEKTPEIIDEPTTVTEPIPTETQPTTGAPTTNPTVSDYEEQDEYWLDFSEESYKANTGNLSVPIFDSKTDSENIIGYINNENLVFVEEVELDSSLNVVCEKIVCVDNGERTVGWVKNKLILFNSEYFVFDIDSAFIAGDLNSNGKIEINDAAILQRYIVGLKDIPSEKILCADVNNDGIINITDASEIQKKCLV